MTEVRQDILVWCDVETMGLRPKSPMLELGFRITDLDTNLIARQSWLVWDDFYMNEWEDVPPVVREMHTKSGLFEEARALGRSEEHTSELQSRQYLVCRLLLEK